MVESWITTFSVLLLYLLPLSLCQDSAYVIRSIPNGEVRGYTVKLQPNITEDTRMLDAFTGIPYARPPVDALRWQYPQAAESWEGVLNATAFSPCCSQDIQNIQDWTFGPEFNNTSEDCLYLNIFAPREKDVEVPVATYPVMVWIHGGANRYGCGEEYDSRILPRYDVIVVTLNYRLGILGYLTTDDEVAPGNYGLLDQLLALHWVQDNIANFGGDPDQVTIFGNSAGGSDTSLHLFSSLAEGLFSRAIEQSGAATAPWALYRPPLSARPSTVYLAEEFGCPTDSSQAMVDCLLLQDADEMVYTYVPSPSDAHSAWAPRVDGFYITDTPENLLASGEYYKIDLLSGTVPDECAGEYPGEDEGWSREKKEEEMYDRSRRYGAAADRIYDAMLQEYDVGGNNQQEQRDLFIELRSDNEYIAPHGWHVLGHSENVSATFLYSFAYRAANHTIPDWMGVPHFEECYYLFGVPLWVTAAECPWGCLNINWYPWAAWDANDAIMAEMIMESWTNFAKTGNPSTDAFTWPAFENNEQLYMIFNHTLSSKSYYKYDRASFNNVYLPKLLEDAENCTVTERF